MPPTFNPVDALPQAELPDHLPRRPVWPWLLGLALVLGGAGWFVWRIVTAPNEQKVLLVVDLEGKWWEGSEGAAALADSLSDRLEGMGFLVVRGGDPEVQAVLESRPPEEAAAKLRAAWLVEADLNVSESVLPVEDGYTELRAEGTVTVRHPDAPAATSPPVSSWSGAKKRPEALRLLGEGLADRVFDAALPLLVEHPKLRDVFHAGASSPDSVLADKLRKAKEYVSEREAALAEAEKKYADVAAKREKAERGPVPVRYLSPPAANDGLCGMGPAGALIKTEDSPLFFLPERRTLGRISALESLAWLDAEGRRKTLWTGYNLYSYPVLGADGASAVIVEDLFGWAKTVTLVAADGKATRLRVDPTHRYSGGRLSPDGKHIAVQDRACRECPEVLLVLDADGAEVASLAPEGGEIAGWGWLGQTRLAVLYTPAPEASKTAGVFAAGGPQTTLQVADLGEKPLKFKLLWQPETDERLSWLSITPDGRKLAFEINRSGDDQIGVFDAESSSATRLTPGPCSSPSLSPDGLHVAFQWLDERGNDEEVGVVAVGGGEARRLTDNDHRDRYPQFSHDGKRIYFESMADDPVFRGRRMVSRIASVPFEP